MIAPTASTMLRASAAAGGLQPMLLRTTACPYSAGLNSILSPRKASSSSSPARALSTTSPSSSSSSSRKVNPASTLAAPRHALPVVARRKASTAAAATPDQTAIHLNWETFFKLRKARRRWQQGFSVVGSVGSGAAGSVALSTGLADPVVSQIPLDPLITLGLLSMSCAALGWLAGPSLGTAVFNAMNAKYKEPMAEKEKQFCARIKKNRVDPTASSVRNPGKLFFFFSPLQDGS